MARDLDALARAHLAQIGVPAAVAAHVTLADAPRISNETEDRAAITISYEGGKGRTETAIANVPSMDDAVAMLSSRERIAPLIAMGVRAMPASIRPNLPAWIADAAAQPIADMRRARRLADAAADTQEASERSFGPEGGEQPF